MLSTVYNNMQVRSRKAFTGNTGRVAGATFVMVNARAIPCTREAFEGGKETCVANFSVIAPHAEGVQRAPFKYNDSRKGSSRPPSKPLTGMAADGTMQFWSYQRKGTDKGERCDDVTWTLGAGSTIKVFFRVEDVEKVLPVGMDFIPEMSVCEVSLVPKSSDPCAEGWGLSVRSVKVSQLSLYSYMPQLRAFPPNREEAKRVLLSLSDKEQPIRRMIDHDNATFSPVCISDAAYTEHVPAPPEQPDGARGGFVKLWRYTDGDLGAIDIPEDVAIKYTNARTVEDAMRLLEIAIAAKALAVLVFTSEYRGKSAGLSECFGVPLVDSEHLFARVAQDALVSEGETEAVFRVLPGATQFTAGAEDLVLTVAAEEKDMTRETAVGPSAEDFILTSRKGDCTSAHKVTFSLPNAGIALWAGYFNTSPLDMLSIGGGTGGGGMCPQRRKWDSV